MTRLSRQRCSYAAQVLLLLMSRRNHLQPSAISLGCGKGAGRLRGGYQGGQEVSEMTTIYSIQIATTVLIAYSPVAMYCAKRAGIPDYGTNPDQKPGWTVQHILTIFPASLVFGFLALMAYIVLIDTAPARDRGQWENTEPSFLLTAF